MKSSEEIVSFIERLINNMLERPHMYASDPQSLEQTLIFLDNVWRFAIGDSKTRPEGPGYAEFVMSSGLSTSQFTSRYYPSRELTDQDREVFRDLANFWKSYLAGRTK